jgi:hypothetical protein
MQTGSVVHPTSYPMATGGTFPGDKRPGHEAGRSPPTSDEVKNTWIYSSTPPDVCIKHTGNITLPYMY